MYVSLRVYLAGKTTSLLAVVMTVLSLRDGLPQLLPVEVLELATYPDMCTSFAVMIFPVN